MHLDVIRIRFTGDFHSSLEFFYFFFLDRMNVTNWNAGVVVGIFIFIDKFSIRRYLDPLNLETSL